MEEIKNYLIAGGNQMTVALGGSTSFDIYPNGWNKTYGLKHYKDEDIFFVGDRCQPGGNDWHIHETLKSNNAAWETTGPEHTIQIIKELIESLKTV